MSPLALPPRPPILPSSRESDTGIDPSQVPDLGSCGLHLWIADLDEVPPERLAWGYQSLDAVEQERAQHYKRPILRQRFLQSRAALRSVLLGYLRISPQDLHLAYGDRGKPYLLGSDGARLDGTQAQNQSQHPLHFNLSHSGRGWVCGVGRSPLGVDLEQRRAVPDAIALAQRFFAAEEVILLDAIAPAAQSDAFLRLWVCKEAILKASGQGITEQLASTVIQWDTTGPRATGWIIQELNLGEDWFGAIATAPSPPQTQTVPLPLQAFTLGQGFPP